MEKIKVLEVIRQGNVGGGESHVIDLVRGFDRKKVEPVIVAFSGGQMIDTLQREGFNCYVLPTQSAFCPRVMGQMHRIIRQERIQMIHAHGSRAASNLFMLARWMRMPLIYTVHGWSFHQDQSPRQYRLRAMVEDGICAASRRVICVSESNCRSGTEAFGLKPEHVTVIENGIDLRRFNADGQFADVRTELGFGKEDFVVGLIARITLQKSPLEFVKSIERAHELEPRIKGLLVGDGDLKEEVMEYIRKHHLEDVCITTPFRKDVPDVLHAIDVYCLPSLWEGLSISLLEAMAMRKPLVVTPTDGTREVVHHEQNGVVVNFGRTKEWAEVFIRLLHHPEQRDAFGRQAESIVKERFDSRRVSKAVEEIYLENKE
jgi:glycosyltransferase involved in cell wall biosynthesis